MASPNCRAAQLANTKPPFARHRPVADVRALDLSPRRLHTEFGGLFLFVPYLIRLDLNRIVTDSGMPGSSMIPAGYTFRALLAVKLWGIGRPRRM